MTTTRFPNATLAVRHGFILVHDTLCHGVTPAEFDGDEQVVLYAAQAEAELERFDAAEMRADAMRDADMEQADDDDDRWVEPAALHPDGVLKLLDQWLTFSADALRALYR